MIIELEIDQEFIQRDLEESKRQIYFSFDQISCSNLFVDRFRHLELTNLEQVEFIGKNKSRSESCDNYLHFRSANIDNNIFNDKALWKDDFGSEHLNEFYWQVLGNN